MFFIKLIACVTATGIGSAIGCILGISIAEKQNPIKTLKEFFGTDN